MLGLQPPAHDDFAVGKIPEIGLHIARDDELDFREVTLQRRLFISGYVDELRLFNRWPEQLAAAGCLAPRFRRHTESLHEPCSSVCGGEPNRWMRQFRNGYIARLRIVDLVENRPNRRQ